MERLILDEAINHEKMMAKRKRWNGKFTKVSLGNEEINKRFKADCIKDAEEHEQFAEWLEELKSYKDIGTPKELKELKENGAFAGLELAKLAIMQKELKEYKDLEEQGLLVRLPVPLGSKVYWISTRDKQNPIIFEKIFVLGMLYFWDSTVFATREEAEKKLEVMKNE